MTNTEVVTTAPARARSRLTLLMMFGLFSLPVIVAWLSFFVFEGWRPSSTSNHGELIEPPRLLQFAPMDSPAGERVSEAFLQGKWTYVMWAGASCEEACRESLYRMRQLRLAQGKNIDRLQRLLLVQDLDARIVGELQDLYPGLAIAQGSAQQMSGLRQQFQLEEGEAVVGGYRLYLVDPMGNLMMRYGADDEPKGIVKDLERLLKISYVG